jgi:DNA-binding transcriptional ArsR family regulator
MTDSEPDFSSQNNQSKPPFTPADELVIDNVDAIKLLSHEKVNQILNLLTDRELTIIDLKNELKMNPGTIKRHLDNLLASGLVVITREEINKFQITMKYYRIRAKTFIVQWRWPQKDQKK